MTKVYSREKKRWVSEEEFEQERQLKLKKAKTCKGGKEHDFQLALPSYVDVIGYVSQESINEFYETQERVNQYSNDQYSKLKEQGIVVRTGYSPLGKYRNYACSVCGKKDYRRIDFK